MGAVLLGAGGRWAIDARKWFKGPVINLPGDQASEVNLEQDHIRISNDIEAVKTETMKEKL